MHRFFLKQDIPESGNIIFHEKPLIHQMREVLKLKTGESIVFFNGSGRDFEFRIAKISPQAVFGHVTKVSLNKRDPALHIYLYQAMIKKNNFEWVLQKCTELGVKTFVPLLSERSIKKGLNRERAEKIVREATEQSGQDAIPAITDPITFSEALGRIGGGPDAKGVGTGETIILCDQSGTVFPNERFSEDKPIHIFVGPEGGYSEKEIQAVRERGGMILSLGQRVLRAETASVAVVSLVLT